MPPGPEWGLWQFSCGVTADSMVVTSSGLEGVTEGTCSGVMCIGGGREQGWRGAFRGRVKWALSEQKGLDSSDPLLGLLDDRGAGENGEVVPGYVDENCVLICSGTTGTGSGKLADMSEGLNSSPDTSCSS